MVHLHGWQVIVCKANCLQFAPLANPPPLPNWWELLFPQRITPQRSSSAVASQLDAFSNQYGEFYKTPLGQSLQKTEDRDEGPNATQLAAMQKILDAYPDILPALRQACACSIYTPLVDASEPTEKILGEMIKPSIRLRILADFVNWKMAVLVADKKQDDAVRRGMQLLQFAKLCGDHATLVQCLISLAIKTNAVDAINDALRAGPISTETRVALDRQLARLDDPEQFARVLESERAFNISSFEGMASNIQMAIPILGSVVNVTWHFKNWESDCLDYYGKIVPLADRPWYAAHGNPLWGNTSGGKNTSRSTLVTLLFPAIQAAYTVTNRSIALVRCLRILNALGEYQEKNGREAKGIADLNLPKEAIIDPFSGDQLRLKSTPKGWVVYSVHENGVDDGGDFNEMKDVGLAPLGYSHEQNQN